MNSWDLYKHIAWAMSESTDSVNYKRWSLLSITFIAMLKLRKCPWQQIPWTLQIKSRLLSLMFPFKKENWHFVLLWDSIKTLRTQICCNTLILQSPKRCTLFVETVHCAGWTFTKTRCLTLDHVQFNQKVCGRITWQDMEVWQVEAVKESICHPDAASNTCYLKPSSMFTMFWTKG